MPYALAGLVLVGVVTVLNLALVLAIIRRLREHTELLSQSRAAPDRGTGILAPGERIGGFTARTTGGETVTEAVLDRDCAVGVFSPTCEPCKERVPEFVAYAGALADGRERTLAVVFGDEAAAAAMIAELATVTRVVAGEEAQAVRSALKVEANPAIYLMGENATVAASGYGLDVLPALPPVLAVR